MGHWDTFWDKKCTTTGGTCPTEGGTRWDMVGHVPPEKNECRADFQMNFTALEECLIGNKKVFKSGAENKKN